ncbi:hypothetical protein [Dolichospermum circinale]|nr:hypothetical protein [Dolichospermum circinale]MDB9466185.1 hypothetical protein [Dolichospermum circinale CS-539/09]MDB9471418.1 hypothetical protein [Dolichospermum circinale CS-539]
MKAEPCVIHSHTLYGNEKRGIQVIEEIILQNRIEFNMEDEIVNDKE